MSILPSFALKKAQAPGIPKLPVEYGVDFATGQLTGSLVYGLEAIKVWVWLCLHTERFRYQLYPRDYGVELEQYIGQNVTEDFLNMDCKAQVEEALLVNPYITGIADFEAAMVKERIHVEFTVITALGEVKMDV